jgi:hypothetical protein
MNALKWVPNPVASKGQFERLLRICMNEFSTNVSCKKRGRDVHGAIMTVQPYGGGVPGVEVLRNYSVVRSEVRQLRAQEMVSPTCLTIKCVI